MAEGMCVFSFSISNSWVFEDIKYSELSTGIKAQKEQLNFFILKLFCKRKEKKINQFSILVYYYCK